MADIDIKIRLSVAKATAQMAKFEAATEKARLSVEKAKLQNRLLEERIRKVGNQAEQSSQKFKRLRGAVDSFIGNLGATATTKAFQLIRDGFAAGVENAISYEKALIGVARTANLTSKEQVDLAKRVADLTKTIPLTNQELLKFSQIAGQLGVESVDQITAFTETFAKLSVATNIAGEESAIAFTKILGLTNELGDDGAQNIAKLGSVITALGNDAKALETDIVSVGLEVAKGLAPFGIASENVLAFATTLTESGVAAEAAGSSIQRIFQEIAAATTEGGKELETFAQIAGLTGEEFKRLFDQSPDQAFLKLAESISKANLPPGQLIKTFEALGINQQRVQRSLIPLITNYEKLERNVNTANKEAKDQQALNAEASKAFKTLGADVSRATESFNSLVRTLVQAFQPAISLGLKTVTALFDAIRESTVLQGLAVGLGIAAAGFTAVAVKAALASGAFGAVSTAATAAWLAITGPVGLVIAGIALVGAAIFILVKKWNALVDTVKGWLGISKKVNDSGKETKKQFDDLKKGAEDNTKAIEGLNQKNKERTNIEKVLADSIVENEKKKKEAIEERARIEKQIRKEEEEASLNAKIQNDAEFVERFQAFQFFNQGRLQALREYFTEEEVIRAEARLLNIDNERQRQVEITNLITEAQSRRLTNKIKAAAELRKVDEVANKIILEDNKELAEQQKKIDEMRVRDRRSTLSRISTLANSNNKELAAIGKAAGITQIAIDTPVAVSKALAAFPPPFNFVAAAAVGAAMAAQAAQIAGVKFEQGGIVGGTSFTGDQVQARVNSGEMILNRQQQSNLFALANGAGNSESTQAPINITTKVMLDNEVVGEATSKWVANGGVLGEVQ